MIHLHRWRSYRYALVAVSEAPARRRLVPPSWRGGGRAGGSRREDDRPSPAHHQGFGPEIDQRAGASVMESGVKVNGPLQLYEYAVRVQL
jgi:hypothetical protein